MAECLSYQEKNNGVSGLRQGRKENNLKHTFQMEDRYLINLKKARMLKNPIKLR